MDKINNKFYIILLILVLLIVIYFVFMHQKVNEFFYGYAYTDSSGCVASASGDYLTKYQCENRYTCSDTGCKLEAGGDHYSWNSCNNACKFKKSGENTCIIDSAGNYDTKSECEDRYMCINGICSKAAEGDHPNIRVCDAKCNIGDYPENAPKMRFKFEISDATSTKISELYPHPKQSFKDDLQKIVINNGYFIGTGDILGISIDGTEAAVIFKLSVTYDTLENIYNDIDSSKPRFIVADYKTFNLIQIEYDGQITKETFPTAPSNGSPSDEQLFLKINNKRNAYSLNKIDYSNLNLDLSKTESLRRIQQEATTKKITTSLPNSIFINKGIVYLTELEALKTLGDDEYSRKNRNEDYFYYETPYDLNTFIRIKHITDDDLEKIRLQGYLDYFMIHSIKSEGNINLRIATIGTKKNNNIFSYDEEFFLLLYETSSKQLKYKQINVNLDIMKLVKSEEQKDETKVKDMTLEEYETFINNLEQLDNVKIRSEVGVSKTFKPLLFDNYYPGLRFEFNLSVRKNNNNKTDTTDILSYTEDSQPSRNELQCAFIPKGETVFECKQMCTDEKETNNCAESNCNDKCNNCGTLECRWNITDYNRNKTLKPTDARIKCFAGNKSIKVTWLKPLSMFPVDKYYITLSNSNTNSLHVYMYESSAEINEYVINSLENSELYDVNLVCKNKFGVSDISNTESVIPDKSKHFDNISEIKHSDYEDTIEKYYNNNYEDLGLSAPINYRQQVSLYEQELVKNDLKDILVDALVHDNNIKQYTLNIF
jgi:hypothetical protein